MEPPARNKQRSAIFSGLTGSKAPAPDGRGDLRGMITSIYGKNARGGPDTARAAKGLGVSQRTVQRWLKGTNAPKPETLKKITTRNRQRMTTKRGRAKIANSLKSSALAGKTTSYSVNVHGIQGPTSDPNNWDYLRYGNANEQLSPQQYEQLLDAWAKDGDDGALSFLRQHYSSNYVDDWHFHGVDGITITPHNR